jgi:IS30 family transposase
LSPEQVSKQLKKKQGVHVSHEWIHQYILAEKRAGGDLYRHLRCQSKILEGKYSFNHYSLLHLEVESKTLSKSTFSFTQKSTGTSLLLNFI